MRSFRLGWPQRFSRARGSKPAWARGSAPVRNELLSGAPIRNPYNPRHGNGLDTLQVLHRRAGSSPSSVWPRSKRRFAHRSSRMTDRPPVPPAWRVLHKPIRSRCINWSAGSHMLMTPVSAGNWENTLITGRYSPRSPTVTGAADTWKVCATASRLRRHPRVGGLADGPRRERYPMLSVAGEE